MTTEVSTRPEIKFPHGKHPNSLKNLKPYPKGTNGHTGGYSLKERLIHSLDKPLKPPEKDAPIGERIVYSTLEGALLREPTPFREVWDRVDGKVKETVAISGEIKHAVVNVHLHPWQLGKPFKQVTEIEDDNTDQDS